MQLLPDPSLLYRTIGGVLDLYFILGDSPEQVIQRYTQVSLQFHKLCFLHNRFNALNGLF